MRFRASSSWGPAGSPTAWAAANPSWHCDFAPTLLASALVGTLWSAVSPVVAFACAGALMLTGAVLVFERAKA